MGEILKDKLNRIEQTFSKNSWFEGYGMSYDDLEWMVQKIEDQSRDIMRIKEAFSIKDKEIERLHKLRLEYAEDIDLKRKQLQEANTRIQFLEGLRSAEA